MKVVAAVGELAEEHGDSVRFTIVSPEETANSYAEIEEYGFVEMRHGLVIFDAEGEAAATMPGHNFTKDEIAANLDKVLAAR